MNVGDAGSLRWRILIADHLPEAGWEVLRAEPGIGLQNQKAPQMIVCGPCFGNNDHIFGSFQS